MKYCTIPPPPKLARYVRCFWVYEGEASTDKPYIYRGYADGCTELVFHYRGVFDQLIGHHVEKSFAAGIHAQTEKFTRFVVDRDWGIFGCYLFPYAIPKLFSLPASDLTDQLTDFSSVLGCEGCELEEGSCLPVITRQEPRFCQNFSKGVWNGIIASCRWCFRRSITSLKRAGW